MLEIDKIITKVFQDEATDQDHARLNDWLVSTPANQKIYDQLYIEWNRKVKQKKAINEEELIDRIWDSKRLNNHINTRKISKKIVPSILKVAVAILILAAFAFLFNQKRAPQQIDTESTKIVIKENKAGQKSRIILTDGSTVWLNSNSSVSYKKQFKDDVREVELKGEAYFEIVSDTTKPFIIKFGESFVEVLGTTFNISAYEEDRNKVISLATGKLNLNHHGQNRVLTPGWIAEISVKTNKINSYRADISANLAWTRDELVFRNATLSEIFPKLERWYGKEIHVIGTYDENQKFNGTFKSEYLNNVLENLVKDDNMTYEIDEEKIILTFN